jgi:pimeloyl-ACP methyl ester carboxylesterase
MERAAKCVFAPRKYNRLRNHQGETMVKRLDVEFQSEGTTVRGWLYVANESNRSPAVVLAGGWCYVREIVMPVYADAFAEAGINALIFDYRNLGVSDGDDRQHLDPWAQIRDYQNALSFLERHKTVDPDRLGVWGISYSGGHALVLAAIDPSANASNSSRRRRIGVARSSRASPRRPFGTAKCGYWPVATCGPQTIVSRFRGTGVGSTRSLVTDAVEKGLVIFGEQ